MKVRNILGISGGKDSAALAIYLKQKYPNLKGHLQKRVDSIAQ